MRTYRIDKLNKTVILNFSYDETIINRIKSSSYTSRFNSEMKHWVIGVDSYSKPRIMDIIKDFNFVCAENQSVEDIKWDYSIDEDRYRELEELCKNRGFAYVPRTYQIEALDFSQKVGNVINGDDVGIGKTFESILYAETTNSFPCLVIVPASVKYNWAEKWREIVGKDRTISVIESNKKNNWNTDVVIINYDIIGKKQGKGATVKFEELISTEWKMVIFDEAHFLKNKTSQRSKAAKKIVKKKPIVQMLSGTVTMSKPVELWNLLVLSNLDHLIANDWFQFVTRYCGGYKGKFGWVTDGATNTIELNKKMRDNFYIRREKSEVLSELPSVTKQVLQASITNKTAINKAVENLIEYIRETKNDEAAEKAQEAEHLVAIGTLRKLAIEGKMKAIEQYLKDWKESGLKLVVFGIHREILEYLSEKYKCPLIAGGVSSKNKQDIVKEWQNSDDIFLFANMQSAGTGVDGLQLVCSNMLILELPWRPSDLTQAIGRLDRSGQKSCTTVTFMLSDETIDLEMWEMLLEKEEATEAVNKGIDVSKNQSGMRAVIKKILKKAKK